MGGLFFGVCPVLLVDLVQFLEGSPEHCTRADAFTGLAAVFVEEERLVEDRIELGSHVIRRPHVRRMDVLEHLQGKDDCSASRAQSAGGLLHRLFDAEAFQLQAAQSLPDSVGGECSVLCEVEQTFLALRDRAEFLLQVGVGLGCQRLFIAKCVADSGFYRCCDVWCDASWSQENGSSPHIQRAATCVMTAG